jgi:excinuclease ABC subunit B
MERALGETDRRRAKQLEYNAEHGIDPQPLRKKIADITDVLARETADTEVLIARSPRKKGAQGDLAELIAELSEQMQAAAGTLQFELAARLRDEIRDLKRELRAMDEAVGT